MSERRWSPYDDPMWVTSPDECFISDDGMFLLVRPDSSEDHWVVQERNPDYPEDDPLTGVEEWFYVGEAATQKEAVGLLRDRP